MDWLGAIPLSALAIVLLYKLIKDADKEGMKAESPFPSSSQEKRLLTPEEALNRNLICPHCQMRGFVRTKQVKRKSGIHGGKATAALLTGGLTLLGTGLSRKEKMTEAHCSNCGATWHF